ncbi:MAG: glycosyltransferase [Candidatus Atribacteria bacterium]|nr:glycosyltransferase [Candidatus Atribacteria bacterium]
MKISIITIVYNNKDYIGDCIESLLCQSYKNIEHIVIDGGSTDGTQAVIEKYKDMLGYYVSEKDSGLYNALNKGIKTATGDIIGILHSDDLFFSKESIREIIEAFHYSKADVVYSNGVFVSRENSSKVKRIYRAKPYKTWYLSWGWIPLHTGIFVKKNIFERIGMYDESYRIASDYDFSLRLFKCGAKFYFLDRYVVKMRLGGKSTTASLQKLKSQEDLEIIRKHNLMGYFTLLSKIGRKVPQYIKPIFVELKQ